MANDWAELRDKVTDVALRVKLVDQFPLNAHEWPSWVAALAQDLKRTAEIADAVAEWAAGGDAAWERNS